jgi:hypothetical protein
LSLLDDLGLREYLNMLPGWGLLWYVEGIHVKTFHSSTLQWLTRPVEEERVVREELADLADKEDSLMPKETAEEAEEGLDRSLMSGSPSSPSPLPSLLRASPFLGHQALAHLSFMDLLGELGGGGGGGGDQEAGADTGHQRRALRRYSLCHALAHACLANDLAGAMRLAFLISFWQRLIADGHFSNALLSFESFIDQRENELSLSIDTLQSRCLSTPLEPLHNTMHPPSSSSDPSKRSSDGRRSKSGGLNQSIREAKTDYTHLMSIREIIHWLRGSSSFILKHPESLPQLAQRAPRDSHVSHATGVCTRVLQFDRSHKWNQAPQCQLEGRHTAQVTVVAVASSRAAGAFLSASKSSGGQEEVPASAPLLIVTGSCDGSIRVWDASSVDRETLGQRLATLVKEKMSQSQDGRMRSSNGSMRISQASVKSAQPPAPTPSSAQPSWLHLQLGKEVACLLGHRSEVQSITLLPNNLDIISVGK